MPSAPARPPRPRAALAAARSRTPLVVLVAVALAGCDLTATAESDSICVTEPLTSSPLPATPAGAPSVPTIALPVSVGFDLGSAVPKDEKGVTTELVGQSISIVTPERADLSGIETAAITVVRPGDDSDVVVFRYTRPAGAAGVTEVRATPDRAVNLVDYLQDRRFLRVRDVTVGGRGPPVPWTPSVKTCASAKIEVDEPEAAGL
jgi:hypothetical protein